jgi:hypothetical protein
MSGIRISRTFEGRCVKTMVRIRPNRDARGCQEGRYAREEVRPEKYTEDIAMQKREGCL